jgi:hypothetical protein
MLVGEYGRTDTAGSAVANPQTWSTCFERWGDFAVGQSWFGRGLPG